MKVFGNVDLIVMTETEFWSHHTACNVVEADVCDVGEQDKTTRLRFIKCNTCGVVYIKEFVHA